MDLEKTTHTCIEHSMLGNKTSSEISGCIKIKNKLSVELPGNRYIHVIIAAHWSHFVKKTSQVSCKWKVPFFNVGFVHKMCKQILQLKKTLPFPCYLSGLFYITK